MKKKEIKRWIALILAVVLCFGLAACGGSSQPGDVAGGQGTGAGSGSADGAQAGSGGSGEGSESLPETVTKVINVATLNGPTGMGMVQLLDMKDKYAVTQYQSPTDIAPKIISGEVDVAALPSNMASVLYNKTGGKIVAVSPIALGVLYVLGNEAGVTTLEDLKGKTVVASGQGGTPEYVLQKILQEKGMKLGEDVKVEWLANHADVNAKLLSQPGTVAMVPEPFVSVAKSSGGDKAKVLFDMNEEWKAVTGQELPMGVLVAQRAFVENNGTDLKVFLKDYKKSVDFVNGTDTMDQAAKLMVEKGFIAKEPIAKAAIPNCHIVLYSGSEKELGDGKALLKTLFETLSEMNPASIGGKLPGEDLYYAG